MFSATKTDLREENCDSITTAEGKKLKRKIKAARLVECSALKGEGLNEIFIEAVRCVVKKSPSRPRHCNFV